MDLSDVIATLMQDGTRARRENRLDDALRDFAKAVELSRQSGDEHVLVRALKGQGQIERDLGRGDAALPLYEEAAAICRREKEAPLLAHTVRHLSDIHRGRGRMDLAEPYYLEALDVYRKEEMTSPLDLATALRPLAILKDDAGETNEATRLWIEARDLYAAANVPQGVAECTTRLARRGV